MERTPILVPAPVVAESWRAVIPIIGASTMSQFADNLRSLNAVLSSQQQERLDKVSAVPKGFPDNFYALDSVRTIIYGGLRDRMSVALDGTNVVDLVHKKCSRPRERQIPVA